MNPSDIIIDYEKVKKLLLDINISKAAGPDEIHPKLNKYLADTDDFINALVKLYKMCLQSFSVPAMWKVSHIIPIHKKGSVHDPNNYRPIAINSILYKLFEKLMNESIVNYISPLITSSQHGFVSGKSCSSNLLETVDTITDMLGETNLADVPYFDF